MKTTNEIYNLRIRAHNAEAEVELLRSKNAELRAKLERVTAEQDRLAKAAEREKK